MTDKEAIQLATEPHKIIDALQCNTVIGFLNGIISDMAQAEWELEVFTNNEHQKILMQEGKSIALKEAEWKNSEGYKKWKEMQLKIRKFRAYRNDLRRKEEMLKIQPRNTNSNYSSIV